MDTTIDITKWKLLDWKFWIILFFIVIVGILVVGAGKYVAGEVSNAAKPPEEGLTGVLDD